MKGRVEQLDVEYLRQHEERVGDMLVSAEKVLKVTQRHWCDVSEKRKQDEWYWTDAEEIELVVRAAGAPDRCRVAVDIDTVPPTILAQNWTDGRRCTLGGVTIPANTRYRVDVVGTLATWSELREKCPE